MLALGRKRKTTFDEGPDVGYIGDGDSAQGLATSVVGLESFISFFLSARRVEVRYINDAESLEYISVTVTFSTEL